MKRSYFKSMSNPTGAENPLHCIHVRSTICWADIQCSRLRGHGPKGLYCKQHAKIVARRGGKAAGKGR